MLRFCPVPFDVAHTTQCATTMPRKRQRRPAIGQHDMSEENERCFIMVDDAHLMPNLPTLIKIHACQSDAVGASMTMWQIMHYSDHICNGKDIFAYTNIQNE